MIYCDIRNICLYDLYRCAGPVVARLRRDITSQRDFRCHEIFLVHKRIAQWLTEGIAGFIQTAMRYGYKRCVFQYI